MATAQKLRLRLTFILTMFTDEVQFVGKLGWFLIEQETFLGNVLHILIRPPRAS